MVKKCTMKKSGVTRTKCLTYTYPLDFLAAARLAQLDKCRSVEWDVVSSVRQHYKPGSSKTGKIMLTVTQVFVAVLLLVGDVTFKPLLLFPLSFLFIWKGASRPRCCGPSFHGLSRENYFGATLKSLKLCLHLLNSKNAPVLII